VLRWTVAANRGSAQRVAVILFPHEFERNEFKLTRTIAADRSAPPSAGRR
jgi:hypothetical protein